MIDRRKRAALIAVFLPLYVAISVTVGDRIQPMLGLSGDFWRGVLNGLAIGVFVLVIATSAKKLHATRP